MRNKPTKCHPCPLHKVSFGFTPDEFRGDWPPKLAVLAERPAYWEVAREDGEDGYGRPLVGSTGTLWQKRCVEDFGYKREDVLICNTLRCSDTKNKYPAGSKRVEGEKKCRQWDSRLKQYDASHAIITYHPAYSLPHRVPQTLKLIVSAFRVGWKLAEAGQRPLVVMGEKGLKAKGLEWLRTSLVNPPEGAMKWWQRHVMELRG